MPPINLLKQSHQYPTLEETMNSLTTRFRFEWTAAWWRLGKIIIHLEGRTPFEELDGPDARHDPKKILALGCGGLSHTGRTDWIGYDLDVQHGKKHAYQTTDEAVKDAMRFVEKKQPYAWEVRLSRSGLGVHVRCMLKTPLPSGADVRRACELYMGRSWMKVDPSVMGRQAMWLYDAKPGKDGFKLIGSKMW